MEGGKTLPVTDQQFQVHLHLSVGCYGFTEPKQTLRYFSSIDELMWDQQGIATQGLPPWCSCVRACTCSVTSVVSDSLLPCGQLPTRLLCPCNSPGKNTEVGCHPLLQGIFPTQDSNPRLLHLSHCRQILYQWAKREVLSVSNPLQVKKQTTRTEQ